jgi:hypothetical protein
VRAAAAAGAVILVAAISCIYGLSARVANGAAMHELSGLTETPARRVDCRHRRYGSYRPKSGAARPVPAALRTPLQDGRPWSRPPCSSSS